MSDKLNIANEMRCFDQKDRAFYRDLTDEERKKFSNFLMIRWGSSVQGATELQHFYLVSTNERLNKHFFTINRHPELQWLCATAVSPGIGAFRHNWIAPKKKEGGNNKVEKFLSELYPSMKSDDIKTLASMTDIKELKVLAEQMGMTKEQIKKELG